MLGHHKIARDFLTQPLAGAGGLGVVLALAVAGAARAAGPANPDFSVIYKLTPDGSAVATDGSSNPITGTLTPGAFTDGVSPVTFNNGSGLQTALPHLGNAGSSTSINFSDGTNYTTPVGDIGWLTVPDWTQCAPGYQGIQAIVTPTNYNNGTTQTSFLYFNGPDLGGPVGNVVYQDLGPAANVLPLNSQVTFSVDVGQRAEGYNPVSSTLVAGLYYGAAPNANYSGGTTNYSLPTELALASGYTDTAPTLAPGTFTTWSKVYNTTSSPLDGDVYLLLGYVNAPSDGGQVDYANVVSSVPEPASVGMLACGGLVLLRRRRR
jgi:hypothetical protein